MDGGLRNNNEDDVKSSINFVNKINNYFATRHSYSYKLKCSFTFLIPLYLIN